MKPPEPAALEAAIRRACAERDWERLAALDQVLAELRTQPQSLTPPRACAPPTATRWKSAAQTPRNYKKNRRAESSARRANRLRRSQRLESSMNVSLLSIFSPALLRRPTPRRRTVLLLT